MATITLNWTNSVTNAPETKAYPNIDINLNKPIELYLKHAAVNKSSRGRIWKMRKTVSSGTPLNNEFDHYEPFNSAYNVIKKYTTSSMVEF